MEMKLRMDFTLAIVMIILVGIISTSFAADLIQERGKINNQWEGDRVVFSEFEIGLANGGPSAFRWNVAAFPYPKGAVFEIEAGLSVKSGYYEIAFLHQGKPSLVLAARPGKPATGKGKVDVTSDGKHIEYRITAKSAAKIRYTFKFSSAEKK